MECKSDKDSIVFSDDKGPMILEFYRAPSGDIRIGGFGGFKGIYFDSEDARRLHGWLGAAIAPDGPFTFQGAGGSAPPSKGKGADMLGAARGGGA